MNEVLEEIGGWVGGWVDYLVDLAHVELEHRALGVLVGFAEEVEEEVAHPDVLFQEVLLGGRVGGWVC